MDASTLLRPYKIELLQQLPAEQYLFFKWFLALTELHRPSGDLDQARAAVLDWAAKLGVSSTSDAIGNILLSIPASPGKESVPSLLLQGHLDIVSVGQFEEQGQVPVKLIDGKLTSGVSTLGSDDGVSIAAMFAIFESAASIPHGPLEALITVDEEVGLVGAEQLAGPPFLKSRSMINLDSEDWGFFFSSCAGSVSVTYKVPFTRAAYAGQGFTLRLSGLMSGHTGLMINIGRANAIKWVVRVLLAAKAAGVEFRLVSITGGSRCNAIPDTADVEVVVTDAEKFSAAVNKANAELLAEFRAIEKKNPQLVVQALGSVTKDAFSAAETAKVLNLLSTIPHGVFQNHFEIEGLVNTSQSLSIVRTEGDLVSALVFARSNEATQIDWLIQFNTALADLAGVPVAIPPAEVSYPWPAALASRVVEVGKNVYKGLFGSEPVVTGIHAGLECGAIQNRGYPDLEAISFGPDVKNAHTIEEYTTVETCVKFFELVKGIVVAWAQ